MAGDDKKQPPPKPQPPKRPAPDALKTVQGGDMSGKNNS
jgi:hypothetical protein